MRKPDGGEPRAGAPDETEPDRSRGIQAAELATEIPTRKSEEMIASLAAHEASVARQQRASQAVTPLAEVRARRQAEQARGSRPRLLLLLAGPLVAAAAVAAALAVGRAPRSSPAPPPDARPVVAPP